MEKPGPTWACAAHTTTDPSSDGVLRHALGSVRAGTYAPAATAPGAARYVGGDALKRLRMTWIVGVWLASFGALVACRQGENETCQVSSDCEDGLTCCRAAGPRGSCHVAMTAVCGNAMVGDVAGRGSGGAAAGKGAAGTEAAGSDAAVNEAAGSDAP